MIFTETKLKGVFIIDPERLEDERGFFARCWCQREFEARGLNSRWVQCSLSFNRQKGTLRGMHYQLPPYSESKLVSCPRGAIYDVVIDLRKNSPTFCKWSAVELNAENCKMLYIPDGFAHGFMTLEDKAEVLYLISEFYHPENAEGVRWNDPVFGITWPPGISVISPRDREYPSFSQ